MMVGNGVSRLLSALPEEHRTLATVERLRERFKEYYDSHLADHTKPYRASPSFLRGCRAGEWP